MQYIIGADGRRSQVRKLVFGDQLYVDKNVISVAFCKYQVKGTTKSMGWMDTISALASVNHTIFELVGRPREGMTSVTLQIFVKQSEFDALQQEGYTFKQVSKFSYWAAFE